MAKGKYKVVIDAGHGGKDSGAVGEFYGKEYLEKDFNLRIATKTADRLWGLEYTIMMTRTEDIYLSPRQRLEAAMAWGANAFVSIHCNASGNPRAHGMEVLYRDEENDLALAEAVFMSLMRNVPIDPRGLKDDEVDLHRNLAVLSNFRLPACLVEAGFITNERDLDELHDEDRIGTAIAHGIEQYFVDREGIA